MFLRYFVIFLGFILAFFVNFESYANINNGFFKNITITSQLTTIYQTSELKLKQGDLKDANGNNLNNAELASYSHKNNDITVSGTIGFRKKLNNSNFWHLDLQFANGEGVDNALQGGPRVNNDVMEDPSNPYEIYVARFYYHASLKFFNDNKINFDIGKFAINDFFDIGPENSNQTTQFLNQAIANNGAFDFSQGSDGHGYSYGTKIGINNDYAAFDLGFFSSDGYLRNITEKYMLIAALTFRPKFNDLDGIYQFYTFSNRNQYGAFDNEGNFLSNDPSTIGKSRNQDNLNKNGFGISITQGITPNINIFAKYGKQDDDRDVRSYLDIDESYMLGSNFSGTLWGRNNDQIGLAYQIARLTGNHRKAHEKGYESFLDRSAAIGVGNYDDEEVLEIYYKYGFNKNNSLSFDIQNISNFYYSKNIGAVQFYALRFTSLF